MNSFARNLVKKISDDATHIMADGLNVSEASGTIDTGSLTLNAALSADLWGGIQDNKIVAFAGEEATGKTFFALALCQSFQQQNPEGIILYYDTEAAVTRNMMTDHGVDPERVIISEQQTIQGFKTHVLKLLDVYKNSNDDENRPPMMVVLDSLGNLSTLKEMEDSLSGKEVVDMTKAKVVRSTFRTLSIELARSYVPLILTNHIYSVIGSYHPMKEMSGGSGAKYAASTICFLSKKKDALGEDGNVITVHIKKSRFTREGKKIETRISHDKGLDRYYGLLPIAETHGLIEKSGNKWKLPNGDTAFEKTIYKNPEKYFTKEFLDQLQVCVEKEFRYGTDFDTTEELAEEKV